MSGVLKLPPTHRRRLHRLPYLPGTDVPDYRKAGVRVEGNTAYPTIPATDIRDYRYPGARREGDMVYPTYPGTDVRDYRKPGYKIENSR